MTPETPSPAKRDVSPKPRYLPTEEPPRTIAEEDLVWNDDEREQIEAYLARYPGHDAAIMRVLWLAQGKYGWLPPEVIRFAADTIDMPYAKAYGVATFYTQYYKEATGKHVLDVCTSFSCQLCGGYDILHHLEDTLGIKKGETTPDGMFSIQEVECLGACGSAPMMQVTNGPYLHNLTPEKVDQLIGDLREDKVIEFESVTLPQDEDELGGNRRSDIDASVVSQTPPVANTLH
ncbi:NAD(P)H-dependent oxidoreductase subunit E [soil metagenome]